MIEWGEMKVRRKVRRLFVVVEVDDEQDLYVGVVISMEVRGEYNRCQEGGIYLVCGWLEVRGQKE